MRSTHLPAIARARFLVGTLGERFGWWHTKFTEEASKRSLVILFPRTSARAALESVVEAARRVHDEPPLDQHARAFHLFRLPIHLEDRLAGWLAKPEPELAWPPSGQDDALAELERMAGKSSGTAAVGPLCLGKPARLNHESTFREIAAVYARAGRSSVRVIPYFEE